MCSSEALVLEQVGLVLHQIRLEGVSVDQRRRDPLPKGAEPGRVRGDARGSHEVVAKELWQSCNTPFRATECIAFLLRSLAKQALFSYTHFT